MSEPTVTLATGEGVVMFTDTGGARAVFEWVHNGTSAGLVLGAVLEPVVMSATQWRAVRDEIDAMVDAARPVVPGE